MTKFGKTLAATLIAAGGAFAMSGAASATDTVSVTIDQNQLETEQGTAYVFEQLTSKAEAACDTPGVNSIADKNMERSCTENLLREWVESAGHDGLTAHYFNVIANT